MSDTPKIRIIPPTEKEIIAANKPKAETRFIKKITLTGVGVIDMLQAAIKFHQDRFISLRCISLKPTMFEKFYVYMEKQNEILYKKTGTRLELHDKREYMLGNATMSFFDVDIKCGSKFQKENMYFEEYFQSDIKKEKKQAEFSDKIRPSFH